MTIVLYVSLEMCSRMGAVTGKGLSELIREEFGFRVTFFLMAAVLIVNLGNVMAEFTGVFWASETFGVSRFIAVPLAAVLVWAIVVAGTAKWVERIFLSICVVYLSYVVSAFLAKPEWLISLLRLLPPQLMHYIPTVRPLLQFRPFTAGTSFFLEALWGPQSAPCHTSCRHGGEVSKR